MMLCYLTAMNGVFLLHLDDTRCVIMYVDLRCNVAPLCEKSVKPRVERVPSPPLCVSELWSCIRLVIHTSFSWASVILRASADIRQLTECRSNP